MTNEELIGKKILFKCSSTGEWHTGRAHNVTSYYTKDMFCLVKVAMPYRKCKCQGATLIVKPFYAVPIDEAYPIPNKVGRRQLKALKSILK